MEESNEQGKLQRRCGDLCKADFKQFLLDNSPDRQREIAKDKRSAFVDECPVLSELQRDYGEGSVKAWLMPQLFNLSEYCGVKEKMDTWKMEDLAGIIVTEFYYLKTNELMLFFYWFKTGKYGKFYGVVDPVLITQALRQFVTERNIELDKAEAEERERKREEDRKGCVSREEYLKCWKDKI